MDRPGDAARALRALAEDLGYPVRPGAGEEALAALRRRAVAELGGPLPEEHLAVLRDADGHVINGLHVHGTADLVDVTLAWRGAPGLDEHAVLADGNQDVYVVHLPTGRFELRDRVPGEVLSRPTDHAALIAEAVRAHS